MSEIQIILSFLCFAFLWFVFVKNKPKLLNKECAWCGSKNKINEHTFNGTKKDFVLKIVLLVGPENITNVTFVVNGGFLQRKL